MKIKAIAPWFGSKRGLAKDIVAQLGPHEAYWEPFVGSCAVLMAKQVSRAETVNDLHGQLCNLARVLASSDSVELYRRAYSTLYSEDLYFASAEWFRSHPDITDPYDIEAAYHYFVVSWMGRNGISGCTRNNWQPSIRYTSGGGTSPMRWQSAVESIPNWHQRLRNVCVLNRDAMDIVPKIEDKEGTVIYADPPYLMATRGEGGGSRYLHDFDESSAPLFGEGNDHERLAEILNSFRKTRIVVSYYDHWFIRKIYAGWTFIEKTRTKNLAVQNKRGQNGKTMAPELLIINGEAL